MMNQCFMQMIIGKPSRFMHQKLQLLNQRARDNLLWHLSSAFQNGAHYEMGNVTILSRSYLFSVILSLFLVLSHEHMFTMMLLNHFLISYAQHLTCCILPCLTLYHAFSSCIPYVYLSYSLLLQHGYLLYKLVSSYDVL